MLMVIIIILLLFLMAYGRMPKRSRAPYKKRKFTKRSSAYGNRRYTSNPSTRNDRNNNIVTVPGRGVMPERLRTQFQYVSQKILTQIGLGSYVIFRGNSLFDPDQTAAGNRANSLTEMSAFYAKYSIIGCSIKVKFANGDVPVRVVVFPNIDPNGLNFSFQTCMTLPKAKSIVLGSNSGTGIGQINNYASTFSMVNVDPATDDTAQAAVTTNPASQWYWVILAKPMDDASLYTTTFDVELTYYTILSQRKVIAYT